MDLQYQLRKDLAFFTEHGLEVDRPSNPSDNYLLIEMADCMSTVLHGEVLTGTFCYLGDPVSREEWFERERVFP